MYSLYIKGSFEPIIISEEDYQAYLQAKEFIAQGEKVVSVEMSCGDFVMSAIKAVVNQNKGLLAAEEKRKAHECSTEELKEVMGDYEKDKFRALMKFLESKGVKDPGSLTQDQRNDLYGKHKLSALYISTYFGATKKDGSILLDVFFKWQEKEEALRELMCRREYMQKMEDKSFEQIEEPSPA